MAGAQRYETPQRHHVACNRPWSLGRVIRHITPGNAFNELEVAHYGAPKRVKIEKLGETLITEAGRRLER